MISTRKCLTTLGAIALGLCLLISVAQAEQPYDITVCGSAAVTLLTQSKELTIMSLDVMGIARSNNENKFLDNCTLHHVRVQCIASGKVTSSHGFTKFMAPDGDCVFVEVSVVGGETIAKFIAGTGKWKGITGRGKIIRLTRGKPIAPGTFQSCVRNTGTFELPK